MDGMRIKTPCTYLCYRRLPDAVWLTARLTGADIPYADAEDMRYGRIGGMPIPVFETLQPIWGAWKRLYDDMDRPPYEGLWLGWLDPSEEVRQLLDGHRDDAVDTLLAVWPHDRTVALLAANHILLHGDTGMLLPNWDEIDEAIGRFDAGDRTWIEARCIDRIVKD